MKVSLTLSLLHGVRGRHLSSRDASLLDRATALQDAGAGSEAPSREEPRESAVFTFLEIVFS